MEGTNNQVAAIQKEFGAKIAEKAFQCGAINFRRKNLSPGHPAIRCRFTTTIAGF